MDPDRNSDRGKVAAILLTAGESRRFGARNKLLADLEGETLIGRALDAVAASGVSEIVAVAAEPDIIVAVAGLAPDLSVPVRIQTVYGEARAMSHSLKSGLAALGDDVDAALVCLADMPFMKVDVIDRIIDAAGPDTLAVVPVSGGRWGNPVLIARHLWPEVMAITGDSGARDILKAHEANVTFVEVTDDTLFADIDTPGDLEQARDVIRNQK